MARNLLYGLALLVLVASVVQGVSGQDKVLEPKVDGDFWQIAGVPDVTPYNSPKQQPVDFAIWQAADGTWQLWSCIRYTKLSGSTRLFYRWQANKLTDSNWTPMGIAMMADPNFGEREGGMQAPYVIRVDDEYIMFYGTITNIAIARSKDGKTFARQLMPNGKSGILGDDVELDARDPMVRKIGDLYYLYYTGQPDKQGAIYLRTSKDLVHWSASTKVAYGGVAGNGISSAECPWVYFDKDSGQYYLLRNQHYGKNAQFTVYRSKDPLDFGKNDDSHLVETMPYAAPEIVESDGQLYLATLRPGLDGIQLARLKFVSK
jgi:hypothetical protein